MNKRQHKAASDVLLWASVLILFILTVTAGSGDVEEAQRQEAECAEMRELWEKTDGRQGWPDCGN